MSTRSWVSGPAISNLGISCCGNMVKEAWIRGKYAFTVAGSIVVLAVGP